MADARPVGRGTDELTGMSVMLKLRPYQIEAGKAVVSAWARGCRRPAVVLPTGTGKTPTLASVVKLRHEAVYGPLSGRRSLVVAHTEELVGQLYGRIRDTAPELSVGIVQAERNETRADVVVGSVPTLRSELRRRMVSDVGLIVVDECHHAVSRSYVELLTHYGALGDGAPIGQDARAVALGMTATMERGDSSALGDVWQEVVYSKTIAEMVGDGYLTRPRGIRVKVDDLDLSTVKKSRGDYSAGDLGRAVLDSMAPELIAKAILEHCPNDPGLVFTPTVEAAQVVAEAMAGVGLRVEVVHGKMPKAERADVLRRFQAGEIDWICNCAILTEGVDLPRVKVVVMARPTKSRVLYKQCVGRALRLYPGKHEAIILDVVGASALHSLNASIELFGEDGIDDGEKPEKDDLDDEELTDEDQVEAGDALGFGEPIYATGPLVSEEFDLFHQSRSAWLRTRAGIWFLPAGERLIALIPGVELGTWDVVAMHSKHAGTGRAVTDRPIHELSYAMAFAEQDVTASERLTAVREQSWRDRKANQPIKRAAEAMGLTVPRGATAGEIMEMITVAGATWRIDPLIPDYAKGR